MKVAVLPADMAGCGSYRLLYAAEYLQGQGHDIEIQRPQAGPGAGLEVHFQGDTMVDAITPFGADVIVMQRVAHKWHLQLIPLLRKKGVAVVIDMDDDLTCIHRKNVAWLNYHPMSNTPYSWRNADTACREATLVTVSTAQLLKVYAKHGRGVVIDNYVPERHLYLDVERDDVFGWAGTTQSHPEDLKVCGRAVQQLIDEGYNFRVVGPRSDVKAQLRLAQEPEVTGVVPLVAWLRKTAELKVALAPLEVSPFNSSKSRLKLAEASAVGVPWVASPRPEYRRFHRESGGAGILAENAREWYKAVKRLMEDEPLRKDLGERGREFMRTQTIEANAWRWLEAWTKAYDIQQADRG
jgi:glycosyltransferase involved in cell wall biosynthesis